MRETQKIMEGSHWILHQIITEMFKAQAKDNQILLGELQSGSSTVQVQLKVTTDPEQFLDDCS